MINNPNTAFIFFLLLLIEVFSGCSTQSIETIYPTLNDGKYDSAFPFKNASQEIENISNTIQRINSLAFYDTYLFEENLRLIKTEISEDVLATRSTKKVPSDQSKAGSATVLISSNGLIGLLTCAHIVDFADTIISYYSKEDGTQSPFIESVSIKTRQMIYAAGFPEGSELDLIAIDKSSDLAFLGKRFTTQLTNRIPSFNYPVGSSKELEWGTFVYIFGFPLNNKMVTNAIVSSPNRDKSNSFLLDAVINRGMSGGIVLAIRDGIPNFELVGLVQWVPEEYQDILVPRKNPNEAKYSYVNPYEGDIFVKRQSEIAYGIVKVISVETIRDFFKANQEVLRSEGYILNEF
ncbi:MAG: trypsin-like peptidase domain-containing protein [Ignavibacteriaceae bacterium]|jgi:hypothetical protein|nr:trypsin-like peptidase domain-containing protein [Ignavibacteriaceae bacterium]